MKKQARIDSVNAELEKARQKKLAFEKEKARKDSIAAETEKARKDSVAAVKEKARQDSIAAALDEEKPGEIGREAAQNYATKIYGFYEKGQIEEARMLFIAKRKVLQNNLIKEAYDLLRQTVEGR